MEVKEIIIPEVQIEKVIVKEAVKEYEFPVYIKGTKSDGAEVDILDKRKTATTRTTLDQIEKQIVILTEKKKAILALSK